MGKARVATKLKEKVTGGKSSLNKSADLAAQKESFQRFSKELKALIVSLKNHHSSMMAIAKTRLEVSR